MHFKSEAEDECRDDTGSYEDAAEAGIWVQSMQSCAVFVDCNSPVDDGLVVGDRF